MGSFILLIESLELLVGILRAKGAVDQTAGHVEAPAVAVYVASEGGEDFFLVHDVISL